MMRPAYDYDSVVYWNCGDCGRESAVKDSHIGGVRHVERLTGTIYLVLCRCNVCETHFSVRISESQIDMVDGWDAR